MTEQEFVAAVMTLRYDTNKQAVRAASQEIIVEFRRLKEIENRLIEMQSDNMYMSQDDTKR